MQNLSLPVIVGQGVVGLVPFLTLMCLRQVFLISLEAHPDIVHYPPPFSLKRRHMPLCDTAKKMNNAMLVSIQSSPFDGQFGFNWPWHPT